MNDSRVITLEDLSAGWDVFAAIETPCYTRTTREGIYDLQGRRLFKTPEKGIYIEDGKKKVIK